MENFRQKYDKYIRFSLIVGIKQIGSYHFLKYEMNSSQVSNISRFKYFSVLVLGEKQF